MSKQTANFKKAITAAKRLYKTGRYAKFSDAVKAAWRQTGSSKTTSDKKRKAKAPGKRKSAAGKVYYERRKNRSDKPGTITGAKSFIVAELKKQLSNRLLRASLATTKKDKRYWNKLAAETKKQIKQFR